MLCCAGTQGARLAAKLEGTGAAMPACLDHLGWA
eukprot:SAG22_NODE_21548_length_256_cov_0.656051_1_plen_33_part_01